ncbi:MAG: hypothetical protein AB7T59_16705 [Hyphomonadaceae bacterium]
MFWVWIAVVVVAIIGLSVFVGKSLSRPRGEPLSQHERITALKASGALKHRKSNRD